MYPPNNRNYEDDLLKLGLRVKQHEDNIKFLRTQKNIIEDSIRDLQDIGQLLLGSILHLLKALPFIKHGAVSLDGGIIRGPGVFDLGDREEAQVKFPRISGKSTLPENYYKIENTLKTKKWDQEKLLDDMRREQSLLDQAKFNFEIKKKEFVHFLAQSSQYAPAQHQQQSPAGRKRFTP